MLNRQLYIPLFSALILILPSVATAQDNSVPIRKPDEIEELVRGKTSEWEICNQTSYVLRVASAFTRGSAISTKGWDQILPGSCLSVTTPALGPRFLFAESVRAHQGGIREWKGTTPLCVDDDADFTSPATEDCALSGRSERNFFAVRSGEPVTTLVEPSDYSRDRAVTAAKQRLLKDNGYAVTRIDGLAGRKTARLLRAFRRDNDLPASIEDTDLLKALVAAADVAQQSIGLEVCNQSSAPIWTAVATREEGRWRSKGWWRAEAETCTKPIDIPLQDTDAHVFALQEAEDGPDKRLRTVATTPAQFCIAESKFDALGNDMCLEQGYAVASFRPVPTEESGTRLRFTDSDFAAQGPGGLRR